MPSMFWPCCCGAPGRCECYPQCTVCPGVCLSVNGTVDDALNGTRAMTYDFVHRAWYSPWLPWTSPHVLRSAAGQDPCFIGTGTSYYFYKLACDTFSGDGRLVAQLFLPGQSCHLIDGTLVNAYFGFEGPLYPAILGRPADSEIAGFTEQSVGPPSMCSPMTYAATWSGAVGSVVPARSATFRVPKFAPPSYGFVCTTPCPTPRRNLTISWTGPVGAGSSPLVYAAGGVGLSGFPVTASWTSACIGGTRFQLFASGSLTIGLAAVTYFNADCTGLATEDNPAILVRTSYECSPPMYVYGVRQFFPDLAHPTILYAKGYRTLTVTL